MQNYTIKIFVFIRGLKKIIQALRYNPEIIVFR